MPAKMPPVLQSGEMYFNATNKGGHRELFRPGAAPGTKGPPPAQSEFPCYQADKDDSGKAQGGKGKAKAKPKPGAKQLKVCCHHVCLYMCELSPGSAELCADTGRCRA